MTREEAISGLKEIRDWTGLPYCIEEPLGKEGVAVITTKMIDMAIKALEQEPSITWVTGADGAKIAFWDVPVWKVIKICEILGEPQESEVKE